MMPTALTYEFGNRLTNAVDTEDGLARATVSNKVGTKRHDSDAAQLVTAAGAGGSAFDQALRQPFVDHLHGGEAVTVRGPAHLAQLRVAMPR